MKNRIKEAMEMRGLRQVDLINMTGIAKGSLNAYVKNRYQPSSAPLYLIAKTLNVSEMWLAGYDCPKERRIDTDNDTSAENIAQNIKYNDRLYNVFLKLEKCTDEQLTLIEGFLNQIIH